MYSSEETEASKSALMELCLALRRYHEDIVLIGGWAPYFLVNRYFPHCGSKDIDLALKREIAPHYETIRESVIDLGYHEISPFRFAKNVRSWVDERDHEVKLDLLCDRGNNDPLDRTGLHQIQDDVLAHMFKGMELAFVFNSEHEIRVRLPNNGWADARIRIIDLVGSFALKGQAILGRHNPKDFYDIFSLTYYNENPKAAADYFIQSLSGKKLSKETKSLLDESFSLISSAFSSPDEHGSFQVELFSPSHSRFMVHAQLKKFLDEIQRQLAEGRAGE
jgi:hypothetical protein